MPKLNNNLTIEKIREQTRNRVRRYRSKRKEIYLDEDYEKDNSIGNNGGW